jgi:hypothetical protein
MSVRLAAALTICQIALGVIPSPQILSSRLTLRKIAPSAMAAALIHTPRELYANIEQPKTAQIVPHHPRWPRA